MSSTWSDNLKIELLGIGDTNWGNLTNNNFKWAIEESITGYATATFPSDADYNWAAGYTNTNASQAQRNLVINVTGSLTQTRNLVVPTIEKQYIVQNNTTGSQSIVVKTSAGTGITVPNGRKAHLYVDGTNVIQMVDYDVTRTIGTLTLTTALSVANGGTGITAFGTGVATALGQNVTGSGGIALATSPVFTTPTLGVATATSVNKVAITAPATSATLTIANGKTLTANSSLTLAGTDAKTLTVNNSLTLAGTDTTVMTFPTTSATIARTDAAQTFTGNQTITGSLVLGTQTNKATISYTTNTARTFTIPNVSGNRTFAFTDQVQTFSVDQVFSTQIETIGVIISDTLNNIRLGSSIMTGVSGSVSGEENIGIGSAALESLTSGDNNVCIGWQTGVLITTGSDNTLIGGLNSFISVETGSRNTVIGASCAVTGSAGSDQVVIGYSISGKGNDTAYIGGTNGAYNEKNVTTWETTSDARLKKNIVDNNDGLQKILAVRVRNFEYRTPDEVTELPPTAALDKPGVQLGVIAQEMLPECVSETSVGVKSVNTDPLVWYLINAVKELAAEVEELKKRA